MYLFLLRGWPLNTQLRIVGSNLLFNLDEVKEMKTLMHPTTNLGIKKSSTKVENIIYLWMIGSLLYLTMFGADIMFNSCLYARFQSDSRETHLAIVKWIFRYLMETTNLGLCFKRRENFGLQGYYDANYVGDRIERKNTGGGCHFIWGNLVSWMSKK